MRLAACTNERGTAQRAVPQVMPYLRLTLTAAWLLRRRAGGGCRTGRVATDHTRLVGVEAAGSGRAGNWNCCNRVRSLRCGSARTGGHLEGIAALGAAGEYAVNQVRGRRGCARRRGQLSPSGRIADARIRG